MGLAGFIISVVSVVISLIPYCNYIVVIPVLVGLALGVVEIVTKAKTEKPKGLTIAGIVINLIALVIICFWTMLIILSVAYVGF